MLLIIVYNTFSIVTLQKTGNNLYKGGLSYSILTKETVDISLFQSEIDILKHLVFRIIELEVFYLYHIVLMCVSILVHCKGR